MKKNKTSFKLIGSISALFLFFIMMLPAMAFFGNTGDASENLVAQSANVGLTESASVGTEYRNLSLNPGADVEEMRFTWHSRLEEATLIIVNPNGDDWELISDGRPAVAHGGVGAMGVRTNLLPTR